MTTRYRRVVDMLDLTAMLQATSTGFTLQDIADRFDVSRRTAERMLGALRETFVEIEAESRDGRKYWRLPLPSSSRPLKFPSEIQDLARRVDDLKAEISQVRETGAMNLAIVDAALANSSVGIFILDADFQVVWTNAALRRYFGLKAEDIHGKDKRELIRGRIRYIMEQGEEFEQRVLDTYENNSYVERFECCVKTGQDRERRLLRHWSQPIRSGIYSGGRVEHYVDLSSDPFLAQPSGQSQAGPVRELSGELVHSIRNPLATVLAVAEGAHSGLLEPSEAIEEILRSAKRISAIVTDTLRLVQDGEPSLAPAVVSELVQEAVDELQRFADERRIELRVEGKPVTDSILVNRTLIAVALTNLIRRSIEAIEEDGVLTVRAQKDSDGGSIRIVISDDGPGISEEIRERAAQRHISGEARGHNAGLSTVKRIVEGHSGRLSIRDGEPYGTVVEIELPARSEPETSDRD